DQSPASVSVIEAEEIEQKQIERVSDALREVPGLSVVQSGAPGQLTSVFTRGLRSAHTQVLLDGIPVNQGLQGAFNFADLTTDNIDRIEVVRGPQSTIYGPSALAGAIQIFDRALADRTARRLEGNGLVGTQIDFRLRSRAPTQRSEPGRTIWRWTDPRLIQTDAARLSKRFAAGVVADVNKRILL